MILLTGANGFIGSHIAQHLSSKNIKFIDDNEYDGSQSIDVVFHEAAITKTFGATCAELMSANYHYPKSLFEDLIKSGCKNFVVASSTAVYGNSEVPYKEYMLDPLNDYAVSKYRLENFALEFAKEHAVSMKLLRYCNVFGPGESHKGVMASMIYQLTTKMMNGIVPRIFVDGNQKRDWIYVSDVVEANLCAMNYAGSGVFNCGSGVATSFNDIISIINKHLGTKFEPEYIDNPFLGVYQNHTLCSMEHTFENLGFRPKISIDEGIGKLVNCLNDQRI